MANLNQARRKFKVTLSQKQNTSDAIPGLLGRGDGTVEVANQAGMVYIRVGNEESYGTAFNNRVPLSDNLPIFVGYDPITDPDRRLFQVLSIRQTAYVDAGNTPIPQVGPHHTTHEFGGGDDVYTEWRRIMGLRVGRPAAFVVEVDTGYIYRGGWLLAPVGANTVDLTAEQAALAGTQAQLILISLDDTGAIEQTNGAIVASPAALTIANCPTPPAGNIPLAAVRIYATQTAIGDTPTAPDIIDLRFPTYDTMGTHSILSITHDDTTPAACVLGDIITGQAGPVWARLAKGTQYQTLQGGATTPVWGAVNLAQATAITGALPVGNGGTGVTSGAWGLTGNAGTTAFTNFAGTTDAIALVFKTRGVVHGVLGTSTAGSVDGNARGADATDFQSLRSNVTEVASGGGSVICGGKENTSSASLSFIGGGSVNTASDLWTTVCGGYTNIASNDYAFVGGGQNNTASAASSSVCGGASNTASGIDSCVPGGGNNVAAGDYSLACGRRAIIAAAHDGAFLFADQTNADFNSAATNEFAVRARGKFRHAYDDSNYWTADVSSAGAVTFDATGASAGFTFSDYVGIGIAPTVNLHVANSINNTFVYIDTYSASSGAPNFQFRRSLSDTLGANTATTDTTLLGVFSGKGNSGSGFTNGAYVGFYQEGAASTYTPSQIRLGTSDGTNNWTNRITINSVGNIDIISGDLTMHEKTAPSAPSANSVTIYAVDNGAGKTQLMALFATGAAQQLAIEP